MATNAVLLIYQLPFFHDMTLLQFTEAFSRY